MSLKHRLAIAPLVVAGAAPAALAADLPVLAEPVDYVRICDAYGSGFYVIPGTETCLRVNGRVRADTNLFFDLSESDLYEIEPGRGFEDGQDGYRFRARAYIYLDARTETEFGLLRTFTEVQFTRDTGRGVSTSLEAAFIQLGGVVLGRADSFYEFTDAAFTPSQFFDPGLSDLNETNLLAYIFEFNERVSLAISLEDETERREGITNLSAIMGSAVAYNGSRIPDVVAALRADGGWGSAQLMGATHHVDAVTDVGGVVLRQQEELGFAVGAGVRLALPFGNDTAVGLTGTFARGAQSYASTSVSAPLTAGGPSFGTDAVVTPAGDLELTDYFSISGGAETSITPDLALGVQIGYLHADVARAGTDFDLDGREDDLDYGNLDLQAFIGWAPVRGLTLGVGAEYRYAHSQDFGDASFLTTYLRAQRTF